MKNDNFGTKLTDERLTLYGENTARDLTADGKINGKSLFNRTIAAIDDMRTLYERGLTLRESESIVSEALEWLTDNFYMAEREGKDGADVMSSIKGLSAVNGESIIFLLADGYLRVGSEISEPRIQNYLTGVLKNADLTERELWGFFSALKCAVILHLLDCSRNIEELCENADIPAKELAEKIGNLFMGLRFLQIYDTAKLLQRVNPVENLLMRDPSGDYPNMTEESRAFYRRTLSHLAEKNKLDQKKAAESVLHLAEEGKNQQERHVGYYILEKPLGMEKNDIKRRMYFECMGVLTVCLAALFTHIAGGFSWCFILIFPAWEIGKCVTDWLFVRFTPPSHIPKLSFENGVPEEGKTLCVISAIISNPDSAAQVCAKLEKYHNKNRNFGENLIFGVMVDLKDSKEEISDIDGVILSAAAKMIDRLNAQNDGKYLLFTRKRYYNEGERVYMGWERKRGGQCHLVRYLTGKNSDIVVYKGREEWLSGVKFLMTLDSDTNPSIGAAINLVGAMLHPLNKAVIADGRVVSGYGILQPRVAVELSDMMRSPFSKLFAGSGGIDPYGSAASDVYQDVFEEAIFTGKGIIDIRAYEKVLDGVLPQNRILSHDLLEGSYLRVGFLSEIEYIDGYPFKAAAYFDRQHRWIRGDWQLLSYFKSEVTNEQGETAKNPINGLSKYKIFDNLRRSVTPIFLFLFLFIGAIISRRLLYLGLILSGLSFGTGIVTDYCIRMFRGRNTFERYQSPVIAGNKGDFLRILAKLLFLPYDALVSISAMLMALYRQFISKKGLLKWMTAAESEKNSGSGILFYCRKMVIALASGGFLIAFSACASGRILGIFWVTAPFIAKMISKPTAHKNPLSENEKLFLQTEASKMWRFFEDMLTAGDNYLPPDNWQEQPASGTAHRTSPTNIGLCALCILAAMDLKLCQTERGLILIERLLLSAEKLQKWHGHLYNWYDTESLRPLMPRFVSTVDSGNFAAALIALREGLLELENPKAQQLAGIADELWKNTDFTVLYDNERRLFSIGWDCEKETLSSGVYDLMASEVRIASYLAVARGDVPKKHWQRLGRALVSEDGYKGMVSWTGTMFEYLMPNLLLPCPEGSLLYETSHFAVYCQRKYAEKNHVPMGVSESGFYAFDPGLNYRYKAHGVPRLGLKTGLAQEMVVSPYSAFLALLVDRDSAIKALNTLKKEGAYGKYGFYEAVDYTKERLPWGQSSAVVRSFMVHHVGMSMLAVQSVLTEGKMIKRFMGDKNMEAFRELLEERLPVGAAILRLPEQKKTEKLNKTEQTGFQRARKNVDGNPKVNLLSNGGYHLMLCDNGLSSSKWGQTAITTPNGISFFLKDGERLFSLYPSQICNDEKVHYSSEMDFSYGKTAMENEDFLTSVSSCVCGSDKGELRQVEITNRDEKDRDIELCVYFEPVLAPIGDYDAHQAFSKLFLQTFVSDSAAIIHRRRRTAAESIWTAFMCEARGMQFDTSRQLAFGRGGIEKIHYALRSEPISRDGDVLDPCVFGRLRLIIKSGETKILRFALAVGNTKSEACGSAERMLKNAVVSDRQFQTAKVLGLSGEGAARAMDLYGKVLFEQKLPKTIEYSFNQRDLWPFGVSGDLPIVYGRLQEDKAKNEEVLKQWVFLYLNSAEADLVLAVSDGGDYLQRGREEINHILKAIGGEQLLGARGGIHVINAPEGSREDKLFRYVAVRVLFEKHTYQLNIGEHAPARRIRPHKNGSYSFGWNPDGSFKIQVDGALPQLAFSHVLANKLFGYLASDSGIGFMWYLNSRENKINRWNNDPIATHGTEHIAVEKNGERLSIFAKDDGYSCEICYGLGFARYSKKIEHNTVNATIFVPEKIPARVIMLEINGKHADKFSIHWENELILGVKPGESRYIQTKITNNGALCANNPYNSEFNPYIYSQMTTGSPKIEIDGNNVSMHTALGENNSRIVLVCGAVAKEHALDLLYRLTDWDNAQRELESVQAMWSKLCKNRQIKTGNTAMEHYINYWALYQVVACRLFARTSLYQCGGAFGFRDQLQDVCTLISAAPELTKTQLLRASCHQFSEGDVLHWWHYTKAGERGVRTKCSDDLLWLPYVLSRYVKETGDYDLLSIETPFLTAPTLKEHEHERYFEVQKSDEKATVYEHAKRAITLVLSRGTGEHGLLLMGSGDWNDGMNLVGAQGKGESQWLTFFFALVTDEFLPVCDKMGDEKTSEMLRKQREILMQNAEKAWDGNHYLRGYYDNGDTLGSSIDEECRIDSIAQSFAALTGAQRAPDAVKEAIDKLFDRENKIAMLFTPAFEKSPKNPGYIKGYLPGVRENGGQYTHGGVWLAMGALESGLCDDGYAILNAILPENHSHAIYKAEPYVLAADVYTNPQHIGRGGWTNYTGAASWYYRTVFESLFGIKKCGDSLTIAPHIPSDMEKAELTLHHKNSVYLIIIEWGENAETTVDGKPAQETFTLEDTGEHYVRVVLKQA